MRQTWKKTFSSLKECKEQCYHGKPEEIKGHCFHPVKGALKDVHFVEKFSFCSTEGESKGCHAYKIDIRYHLRDKNSFENKEECMSKCRGFGIEEIKPCNITQI